MEKKRQYYIDGYKGLLCFMIMFGHFWNIYRLTSGDSPLDCGVFDLFTKVGTKYRFVVATFWLYAFMIISGYLLSYSKINSTKDLLTKTICRFLRLFVPILGACIFIFLISKTVGFHASDTAAFFENSWFQKYYHDAFQVKDIFAQSWRAMFDGGCSFNNPFWVISDMMIASVLIYICKLTDYIFQKRTHVLPIVFLLCALFMDSQVVTGCFAGFLIGYYEDGFGKLTAKFQDFFAIFLVIFGMFMWLKSKQVFPAVIDAVTEYTLIHSFLFIGLLRFRIMQRIFSAKIFLFAGKISFGVYSFHWPVICSAGSLALLAGAKNQWHPSLILLSAFAVSVACTVTLSVVYRFTVEKFSEGVIVSVRKLSARLPE